LEKIDPHRFTQTIFLKVDRKRRSSQHKRNYSRTSRRSTIYRIRIVEKKRRMRVGLESLSRLGISPAC
jgi:hypothetical protein